MADIKTSTPTLVWALRILAAEIETPDGVASMAIVEAADRIEELRGLNDALAAALRGTVTMLESWHSDMPQHVGDKEPATLSAAHAALASAESCQPAKHQDSERLDRLHILFCITTDRCPEWRSFMGNWRDSGDIRGAIDAATNGGVNG